MLTVGVGNAWGDPVTIFQETFGDNGNRNTAYGSATCYTATASMFTTGSAATNYSGSGSVGKGNLKSPNYSSGYTNASGKSGCYQSGTASTTSTIIQISNIKITGYSSLHLSFGALGGSKSHKINVYYKIDSGSKTQIITNGSLSSTSWSLKEADISKTGTNLTLYFEHTPTNNWLMRLDDIIVTGTAAAPACSAPAAPTNSSISSTGWTAGWTAPASAPGSGYVIVYKNANSAPGDAITESSHSGYQAETAGSAATSKTITLSGVSAGETCYWWIRSKCGTGNYSSWLAGTSFVVPQITAGSASGTSTYVAGSGPGSVQTFTVSGVGLTGNLTVTAPSNFQVSTDNGSTWSTSGGSKTITASGTLSSTTVKFRLASDLAQGSYGPSNIVVSGGGAASVNVSVSGTVSAPASTWKFKYSGDGYTEHTMTESAGVASYSISLAADSRFNFCIDDNGTAYKNNGTIITTTTGWTFNTTDGNCNIHTGPAGTYTFAINTTSKVVTVTYPDVSHPNEHYVYFKNTSVWTNVYGYLGNTGNSNKAAPWPGSDMKATTTICGETYHYAALNAMSGTYNVIVFNNNDGSKTSDLSADGLGKFNANQDANWHDFKYAITYAGNGNTGGSMSNVSNICIGSNQTLASNGFTRTNYNFTGWVADVDVKIGGATVTAGTLIENAATIQDIQSNITLTAQWVHVPEITASETARAFGDRKVNGGPYNMTFNVSGQYLTGNICLAITGTNAGMFSVNKTSLTPSTGTVATTEITVSYSPTGAGSHTATLTISSDGATSKTVALSGTGKWEVVWSVNGGETTSLVANGTKPTLPSPAPSSCDATSTTFMGWATSSWTGKLDDVSDKTIHTDNSTMSNITANGTTFYAVFAKATGAPITWDKVASLASLSAGDVFVWASGTNAVTDAGTSSAPTGTSITVNGSNQITSTVTDAMKWTFSKDGSGNYTFYPNGDTDKWLRCNTTSSSSNNENMRIDATTGRNKYEINGSGYLVTNDTYTDRYFSYYSTGNDFRGYTNTNNGAFAPVCYKKNGGTTYSEYLTSCCDLKAVTALTVSSVTGSSVTLTWTAPSPATGIDHLELRNASTNAKIGSNISVGTTTATVSDLTECETYSYKVVSVGSCEMASATVNAQPYSGAKTITYKYHDDVTPDGSFTTDCSHTSTNLPNPSRTGYTLNGWYTDASSGTKKGNGGASYTPDADITLHAQWSQTNYTVTMQQSPAAGATLTGGTTTAHYGGTINISTDVPSGYRFNGWTSSPSVTFASSSSTSTSFTMPANNVTVTANFVQIHAVSFSVPTGGGTVVSPPSTVDHGGTLTFPNVTDVDCGTFLGWTTAANSSYSSTSTTPTPLYAAAATTTINDAATFYAVYSKVGDNPVAATLYAHDGDVNSITNAGYANTTVTATGIATTNTANYKTKFDDVGDKVIFQLDGTPTSFSADFQTPSSGTSGTSTIKLYESSSTSGPWTEITSTSITTSSTSATLSETTAANFTQRILKLEMTSKGYNMMCGDITINGLRAPITYTTNPSCIDWRLQSIAVTTAPTKTTYDECEEFDPAGMVVTATMYDNDNPETTTTKAVAGYTWTPEQFLTPGNSIPVTISYTEKGVTRTTTQTVRVNDLPNYTITFHDGDGTTTWTQANHCDACNLDSRTGSLACGDYTFAGWSTSSTTYDDENATITTWVSGSYTPTANTHLYAVYLKGAAPAEFTANCIGGTFTIGTKNGGSTIISHAANVGSFNSYEYGVANSDYTEDQLGKFLFEKVGENTYKISLERNDNYGGGIKRFYIAPDDYSAGTIEFLETYDANQCKWKVIAGTSGSWRIYTEFRNSYITKDYGIAGRGNDGATPRFRLVPTGNINGSDNYDVELSPVAVPVYQSNPNCASTYTITFNTHGGTFVQGNYAYATETTSGLSGTTTSKFPSATLSGCTFVGWKEGNAYEETTSSAAEDDMSDAPYGLFAADANLSVSSNKTYHAVYHYYDDDIEFDPIEGGTYHMYATVEGVKHFCSAAPGTSFGTIASGTDCEDVVDVVVTPGTGVNAGKYKINIGGYDVMPELNNSGLKRGTFWWNISEVSDNLYHITAEGAESGRSLNLYASTLAFTHYKDNGAGLAYDVSFGRCRQHHWTSEPVLVPMVVLNSNSNIMVTSTNGQTLRSTTMLTVTATHYGETTKIYLSANVAGVGFLKSDGTALSSDAGGSYLQTDAEGELATSVYVTYAPTVTTDGIENVTITARDGHSPSPLSQTTRSAQVRHLPTKFIIAQKVGDDWYALPNDMGNNYTSSTAAVKLSSVNESTGVATFYSEVTDQFAYQLRASKGLDNKGMVFSSPVKSNNVIKANTTSSISTIGLYAQSGWTGANVQYYEFTPTTNDLVDYTLKNTFQNNFLGITTGTWGIGSTNNVHFFSIDQQPAPTITWYNDMLDADHATNKAENGVVTLPTGADPVSCNSTLLPTFCGWKDGAIATYVTSEPTYVQAGDAATTDKKYYAVFKHATLDRWYTDCPTIYTITYTANGGTGSDHLEYTMTTTADAITVGEAGFSKKGCTFVGWTNPDDVDGTIITPGAGKITGLSGDITLNAVWIGTTTITGTVRLTTAAGEKVATSGTEVTISSTDFACATALRITYKDVTNDVTYGRSGTPNYTSSEFRLCNGSYGSADGGNISLAEVSGAYNQTFSITYEPNGGANTLDHYQLKVEVLLKNTVIETKTLDLYGRTLPASFAIAIKVGGSWYALPNNMGSSGTYDPILISVTEDASVLNWAAQGPSTVAYKMKDYTPNYSKLRFAADDATEYCLWAATGSAAGIRNYSASSTDANYAWTVAETNADFSGYTMANLANTRTALKINDSKWQMYNSGGLSEIHFIPLTTVTPIDVTVMEWGADEIAVKTVANWTPSAITAQISGGSPSAVTKTSIGGDLYKLTGVGDLQGNPGEPLALNVTDGGAKQAIIQIPFIVTDTKTEADLADLLVTAGYADTRTNARNLTKNMDVIVRRNGTLSSSSSTSGTFQNVYIYPGGKADFSNNISIQNIYMRGGFSWLGGAYAHPQMNVASTASISGIGSTGHGIFYDLYLDNSIYYVFALPKDVSVTTITNEENGDDWDAWIKSYSGEGRTLSPKVSGWSYVTSGSIARGAGYEIAIKPRLNRPYGILRFPLLKSTAWSTETDCTPSVTGWGANNANVSDNNKGWNFIGNPFLTAYNNAATPGSSPSGLIQTKTLVPTDTDPWDGKYQWATSNVKYFTVPRYTEYEYDDVRSYPYKLDAFFPFFIQVTGDGTVSFDDANKALKTPARYAGEPVREVFVDFQLNNSNGQSDVAGLTISDQYSDEFDMNDKEKTIQNGNNTMKLYTLVGEYRTAFNALTEATAALPIPVGIIAPTAGTYRFAKLEDADYSEVEHLWLTDYLQSRFVDLLVEPFYEFTTEAGRFEDRFAINATLAPKQDTPTDIDGTSEEIDQPLKFLYRDKIYILRNGVIYDATGKQVREIK